ncbi:MAG: hypothetical protein WA213_12505 [Terriglobales bacterium]
MRRTRKIAVTALAIASVSIAPLLAQSITGTVRNQTTVQPAGQAKVFLLLLNHGLAQEAQTKTDLNGSFHFRVRHPRGTYLVRVLHQGVTYDKQAIIGEPISVNVFDTSAKVRGLTCGIEILRIGTVGNHIHVSDMIQVRNDSSPPLTQAGTRAFEVFLPPLAKIGSVLAADSEDMGMMIPASALPDDPGHYAVNFPLRPGATGIAFNYDIPYHGLASFRIRAAYPVQRLAIIIPSSMKFSSSSAAFVPTRGSPFQVETAAEINPGDGPEFEISGTGAIPGFRSQLLTSKSSPLRSVPSIPSTLAGSSHPTPAAIARSPRSKFSYAIPPLSSHNLHFSKSGIFALGTGLTLVICAFLFQRKQRFRVGATSIDIRKTPDAGLEPLQLAPFQQELRQLEVDRSDGTVSAEEYVSAKLALQGTIKRVQSRQRI